MCGIYQHGECIYQQHGLHYKGAKDRGATFFGLDVVGIVKSVYLFIKECSRKLFHA